MMVKDDVMGMMRCMNSAGYLVKADDYECGFQFNDGWVFVHYFDSAKTEAIVGIFFGFSSIVAPCYSKQPIKTFTGDDCNTLAVGFAEGYAQALQAAYNRDNPLKNSLRGAV